MAASQSFSTQIKEHLSLTNGRMIYALVGAVCVLIWALISGWPGPMTAISYEQERLDTALPAPGPDQSIEFTFTPTHDGLSSVEIVVVNFGNNDSETDATAVINLIDSNGRVVTSQRLINSLTSHNQSLRLDFEAISRSKGEPFSLTMTGGEGNTLSVWGYSLNVWPDSSLSGGGEAETLHMKVRYDFQWSSAFSALGDMLGRFWLVIFVGLLYIPLPGALLLKVWPDFYREKPIVRIAFAFGLGIVLWPLVWQWLTVIGLRFPPIILQVSLVIGWIAVIALSDINIKKLREPQFRELGGMILFLLFIFSLRLLAARDLAFLPWVDSSRHALITAIMRDSGQFLTGYEPYLPVSWSGYHYGFHTLSAGIGLILGDRVSLPDQLIPLMQLLSTLTTLTVFAGAYLMTRSRAVGWIAGFMLAMPFLFPAYYTTWGRLTQISGMIVLPLLVGLVASTMHDEDKAFSWDKFVLGGLLTAGLFLLHARVFFYFIPFGLVIGIYFLYQWFQQKDTNKTQLSELVRSPIGQLVGIALTAALLVAPRIIRLLSETTYVGLGVVEQTANQPLLDFPFGYVTAGWEQWFWILAALAVPLAVINRNSGILADRDVENSTRWFRATMLLALWLALLYLLTAGPSLHPSWPILLPQSSINSAYIASFAAEAMLIGIAVCLIYEITNRIQRLAGLVIIALIGAGVMACTIFGVRNQVVILNRSTILGHSADLAAIEWIEQNAPTNAKVANNAWLWLGATWAGTDGAAWLTPMTGRLTGTPPIDHIYNSRLFGITSAFNQSAAEIEDWSDPSAIDLLRQNGFSYIFTGVSDGAASVDMDPAELMRNPSVAPVFAQDGVFVFEILDS